ncbi:MAG: SpoIID/LytB domain-containing protein [Myxococcota bacterium]
MRLFLEAAQVLEAVPAFRGIPRAPGLLATLCVLASAFMAGPLAAEASKLGRTVRVLVYDQAAAVDVGRVDAPARVRLNRRGELEVNGRVVGDPWSPGAAAGASPNHARRDSLSRVGEIWRVGERTYRGAIRVTTEAGRIQVLNRVRLEDYVTSILGAEMSPSWPAQALQAQAVAARTYALHHAERRSGEPWDVQATVASQVYRGISAESPETRAATQATAGEILTYKKAPILAVFHSTSGGQTATAGEVWGEDHPYLRSVEVDEEDDAPHTYWRSVFKGAGFESTLVAAGLKVGRVSSVQVVARTGSGRVRALRIAGGRGVAQLEGDALRNLVGALALRSRLFDVRAVPDGFAFVGSGYGHGVGMSQWGARGMAERGDVYQRILARFYPGARLERREDAFLASHGQSRLRENDVHSGRVAQGDPQ